MSRAGAPLGSRLLGRDDDDLRAVRVRVQTLLTTSIVVANVVGAVVASVLVTFVIPGPSLFDASVRLITFVAVPVYVVGALVVGVLVGTRRALRTLRWAREGREPTEADRAATFAVPGRLARLQAVLWAVASATFTLLYGLADAENVARVGLPVLLSGIVVSGHSYLLAEFALRPVAARALASADQRPTRSGVRARGLLSWAVGSGVPVVGLMTVAVVALARDDVSAERLAVTVLALGGVTLAFGLLLTGLALSATVAPIRLVRRALAQVERGDLGARVAVFDATELGDLQAGFNRMVQGLAERERLRDLFGRQVGREVAEAALRDPPRLGGEEREVAVFFVDLVGSTALAEKHDPADVVALLNRFFSVVVDVVEQDGGRIDKFEGDGALAVFGAPVRVPDAAGAALRAARTTAQRLAAELPECPAALGVAAGRAVAGNVGDERRFEYTVIGDPVNEAARLCELAKEHPGRLLASAAAVDRAAPAERELWSTGDSVVLRGRSAPTRLAVPG